MYEYNDYVSTARRWLKNYNRFKTSIQIMEGDIREMEIQLESDPALAAPVAKYGDSPGGGTPELNKVEQAASDRIHLQKVIDYKKQNIAELRRVTQKVDIAMATLNQETQRLVKAHYIDGYDWYQSSQLCNLTYDWTRKKGYKALEEITNTIFGVKSLPPKIAFVFQE